MSSSVKTRNPTMDLNEAVPYLLATVGARMGNAFSKKLKAYGLSLSEWRVCAALHYRSGQTLSEVCNNTSADLSAMSRTIDRLVAMGWVERRPNETDGRSVRLVLSDAGVDLTQAIIPLAQQYEKIALSDFSPEEVAQLRDFLHRIHANAQPLV